MDIGNDNGTTNIETRDKIGKSFFLLWFSRESKPGPHSLRCHDNRYAIHSTMEVFNILFII